MVLVKKDIPQEAAKTKNGGGRSKDRLKQHAQDENSGSAERQAAAVQPLRVAIVHDWLIGGGAELVVEQLHKMYPKAPIYTSYCSSEWRERLHNKVVTGWLQHWPFSHLRKFIPVLRILWFTSLDLEDYDIVISSSGAEAKGIKTKKPTHINYCHAPTHYYWSRYDEYMQHPGFGPFNWLARFGLKLLAGPLRKWDKAAAQRPDYVLANSRHTKAEVKKYYGREAIVVHPPVYFERFSKAVNKRRDRHGFIISGRQTPYKRFDLAVEACSKLGLPLTVIGDGPDHKRLQKLASSGVTFLGKVSDEVVEEEFASAEAFIFPGVDDFGITAVEALASGTPVIAYQAGGALDYVQPGRTGAFFKEQNITDLARSLREFKPANYTPKDCRLMAKRFSTQEFQRKMNLFVSKVQTRASAK